MGSIFSDMDEFLTPVPSGLMKTEPVAIKRRMARHLGHLDALESEAIHIMREVAAECANPTLLFSGGKDSIVLLRLAEKAFRHALAALASRDRLLRSAASSGDRVGNPAGSIEAAGRRFLTGHGWIHEEAYCIPSPKVVKCRTRDP